MIDQRHTVLLPSGQRAADLRRDPLCGELLRLGIPNVSQQMGKEDLLGAYLNHLRGVADTFRGPQPEWARDIPLPMDLMRRALDKIAANARLA